MVTKIPSKLDLLEKNISEIKSINLKDIFDKANMSGLTDILEYDLMFKEACNKLDMSDKDKLSDGYLKFVNKGISEGLGFLTHIKSILENREISENAKQIQIRNYINKKNQNSHENIQPNPLLKGFISASQLLSWLHNTSTGDNLDKFNELLKKSEKSFNNIKVMEQASSDASQKIGVSSHANIFHNQANDHLWYSKVWLVILILIGLLAVPIICFYKSSDIDFDQVRSTLEFLYLFSPRILLIGLWIASLKFSAQNYRTHRHRETLCRHKENSLQTFKTFTESAESSESSESREAILLECTKTIFEAGSTGQIKDDKSDDTKSIVAISRLINRQ